MPVTSAMGALSILIAPASTADGRAYAHRRMEAAMPSGAVNRIGNTCAMSRTGNRPKGVT